MELKFEKLSEKHASALFQIWTDQDVIQYTYVKNIHSIEDSKDKISRYLNYPHGLIGPFVVKQNQKIIGLAAGMSPKKDLKSSEIFFHFAKEFWRKGCGSKTVDFLLSEGFNENNLNEIQAQAVSDNIASCKLLEKKGFGHKQLRKKAFQNEKDVFAYTITKEEFLKI